MKRRVMLTVAYDGTCYHGWQVQSNADSIEAELNLALSKLLPQEAPTVTGASRTDSGVHAHANVAVIDTDCTIPDTNFPQAVNRYLPGDIRVMQARDVSEDFHPRFTEHSKSYEYHIDCGRIQDPMKCRYCYHYSYKLDIDRMKEAAGYLLGEHDFTSFVNPDSQVFEHGGDAVRIIYSLDINSIDDELIIKISGSGFLYHMIRIIVGTLLFVGTGKLEASDIKTILEQKDRTKAGPTVPAHGLVLTKLDYGDI